MEITINIPDEIAIPLDENLKKQKGQPIEQPNGSVVQLPIFPKGLADWITVIVAGNLRKTPIVSKLPVLEQKRKEMEAKKREFLDLMKPTVTMSAKPNE